MLQPFYYDLTTDINMKRVELDADGGLTEEEDFEEVSICLPTVIVEAESSIGIRISKDTVPTWWTYDLREEVRSDAMDGSQEHLGRLSKGPGRYFIAVYGNSLVAATGVRYRIVLTTASAKEINPPGPDESRTKAMTKATSPYWAKAKDGEIPLTPLLQVTIWTVPHCLLQEHSSGTVCILAKSGVVSVPPMSHLAVARNPLVGIRGSMFDPRCSLGKTSRSTITISI
ncbi:hypothetical protein BC829DRAFT_267601 [Chytridium lagenaria]|nr:hypothetical protein BC829DRAFT_267601 [Chytridium lagenaria]